MSTSIKSNHETIYTPINNQWNNQQNHSLIIDKSHLIDCYKTDYLLHNSSNHMNVTFIFENGKSMSYKEIMKSGFGNWAKQIYQLGIHLKTLIQDDYNAIWGLAALILVNYKSINYLIHEMTREYLIQPLQQLYKHDDRNNSTTSSCSSSSSSWLKDTLEIIKLSD
ncbi:hypothetical protein KSF78_0000041 [Schistosoma japonicum]|nr:hypothetical protein KSF78_0000041 [Schistosoma japonicum]